MGIEMTCWMLEMLIIWTYCGEDRCWMMDTVDELPEMKWR